MYIYKTIPKSGFFTDTSVKFLTKNNYYDKI